MKINLLNERITVQCCKSTTDEIGNHINDWVDMYRCFATVSGTSSSDNNMEGTITDSGNIDFTIRFCSIADMLHANTHRVIFRNEIYNIEKIDFMNCKRKCIKLKCRKVNR